MPTPMLSPADEATTPKASTIRLSRISGLWFFDSQKSSGFQSLGEFILWLISRGARRKKSKALIISAGLYFLTLVATVLTGLESEPAEAACNWISNILVGLGLIAYIGFAFWMICRSGRPGVILKLTAWDVWISSGLFLTWVFVLIRAQMVVPQASSSSSAGIELFPYLVLIGVAVLALGLSTLMAFLFSRRFKGDRVAAWPVSGLPRKEVCRFEFCLAVLGLLAAAASLLVIFNSMDPLKMGFEDLLMSWSLTLPFTVGWSHLLSQRILQESKERGVYCSDFSRIKNFFRFRLFAFHQMGVTTGMKFKLNEHWFDPSDEWTIKEIEEIVVAMSMRAYHPIAEALLEWRSPDILKNSKIKIDHFQTHSHLGLEAHFFNRSGRKVQAVIGGLSWLKVLQHEVDPTGMERIQAWKSSSDQLVLLSLNRRVVAGFLIDAEQNNTVSSGIFSLQKVGGRPCLLSSRSLLLPQVQGLGWLQLMINLLPVERFTQWMFWKEREPRLLEVKAWWDVEEGNASVVLTDHAHFEKTRSLSPLILHQAELNTVAWMVKVSRLWRRNIVLFLALAIGLSAATAFSGLIGIGALIALIVAHSMSLKATH